MNLPVKEPVSHICIHDCGRCHKSVPHELVLFSQFILRKIQFPSEPVDCQNTKVDLSCFFGGKNFASNQIEKSRPTLVTKNRATDQGYLEYSDNDVNR